MWKHFSAVFYWNCREICVSHVVSNCLCSGEITVFGLVFFGPQVSVYVWFIYSQVLMSQNHGSFSTLRWPCVWTSGELCALCFLPPWPSCWFTSGEWALIVRALSDHHARLLSLWIVLQLNTNLSELIVAMTMKLQDNITASADGVPNLLWLTAPEMTKAAPWH